MVATKGLPGDQEAQLLRAISAAPGDDAPRLAYASWLEAQGQTARAELIRVQLALAPMVDGAPEAEALRQRQHALLREHQDAWQDALPELPDALGWGDFHRGFVDHVLAAPGEALQRFADEILAAIPLQRVTLVCMGAPHALGGSAVLAQARELVLLRKHFTRPSPPVDDPTLAEALALPTLPRLTHLGLHEPELSETSAWSLGLAPLSGLRSFSWRRPVGDPRWTPEALLDAPWLSRLERLELERHPLQGALLTRLCDRLEPSRLRRLALRGAALGDDDAGALAASGRLAGLELLDLGNNQLGPRGVLALLGALPPSARLLLEHNPLGDEGLAALASSPQLAHLCTLPRVLGELGDVGLTAVARSPYAQNLTAIYFPRQKVTARGAEAVLSSPYLPRLTLLNLEGNRISALPPCHHPTLEGLYLGRNNLGDDALVAFCAHAQLPSLARLGLDANGLGPRAARALGQARGLPKLSFLSLSDNPLGDAGAAALLEGEALPALRELVLRDCGVGDTAARAWMASPGLGRLKKMDLWSEKNPLGPRAYEALREAALARGCDVDFWSLAPRLKPVRRPTTRGAALLPAERVALTRWVNLFTYAEYRRVAWLKAAALEELRDRLQTPRDARALDGYLSSDAPDDALCRAALALFLQHWMVSNIPESVGVWGLAVDDFHAVDRAEALATMDAIVKASEADPDGYLTGRPPRYVTDPNAPAEPRPLSAWGTAQRLPSSTLRALFARELLDPSEARYFVHTAPGGPTVRFNHARPRVVGMDRTVVALLWLE
ncbi:MAG: TIGR02996 domain-containing protein [Deltaproteobacteria bacterium]|nr:TIGR02996 domain-containing protein [Deltaproteobacteria bacterium]